MATHEAATPATAAAPGSLPPPERRLPVWLVPFGMLLIEVTVVIALGIGIGTVLDAMLPQPVPDAGRRWLPQAAVAGCYVVLSLIFGTAPRAPSTTRLVGGVPTLAAAFACGLLTTALHRPGLIYDGRLAAIVAWIGLSLLVVAGLRPGVAAVARRVPLLAAPRRRIAIVGNSRGASGVLDVLRSTQGQVVDVVGYFDDRQGRTGPLTGQLQYLGTVDDLIAFVEDQEISDVYLALPWTAGDRIAYLVERMRFLPMTVRLVPDEPLPAVVEGREAARMVLPALLRPPMTPVGLRLKAAFDIVVGSVLALLASPIFLVVPVLIRLDSPGPVFFRQMRIGQYGRRFSILKYRSLHVAQADAAAETLVTSGDRRVTRVGRYLRKYSVDELPQLLNVLRGEMSLVGPRPHAPRAKADGRLYSDVVPDYLRRYRVCPGLTGWAQVNGYRGETDTEDKLRGRVAFDFDYIRNWSFLFDLWILLRTIPAAMAPPAHNR